VSTPGDLRPVDRLLVGYNALLAVLWLLAGVSSRSPWWAPLAVGAHAFGCLLPGWLMRGGEPSRGPRRVAVDLYPFAALALFFEELGPLLPRLHRGTHDAAVEALDRWLFGMHPHAAWMPAMPYRWLSEAMFAVYCGYYLLIYLPPIVLAVRGRREAAADVALRLMTTYLACYLLYLAFPVVGPHLTTPPYRGPLTDGLFYRLSHMAHAHGDAAGTAFPSSHVAGSVAIALACRRWLPGPWSRVALFLAVSVAPATVYTRNHYAVDVVAGLLVVTTVHVLLPALRRALSPAPATPGGVREPVPILPSVGPWSDRARGLRT
jgi:membrane-associated phospholipid phosphatase